MKSCRLRVNRLPKDDKSGSWTVARTARGTLGTAGTSAIRLDTFQDFYTAFRHLAVVGKKGHVATFDWQAGTLHTELQLGETCRDITSVNSYSSKRISRDP